MLLKSGGHQIGVNKSSISLSEHVSDRKLEEIAVDLSSTDKLDITRTISPTINLELGGPDNLREDVKRVMTLNRGGPGGGSPGSRPIMGL